MNIFIILTFAYEKKSIYYVLPFNNDASPF